MPINDYVGSECHQRENKFSRTTSRKFKAFWHKVGRICPKNLLKEMLGKDVEIDLPYPQGRPIASLVQGRIDRLNSEQPVRAG